MKALLLVDIQNDFLPGGSLEVKDGDKIIPAINSLQHSGMFDLIIATQDWHPADHLSFASNHPGSKPFDKIFLDGLEQILWPDHCIQDSYGADLSNILEVKKIEALFRKGMEKNIDTYSGFFDNGHKKNTGLAGYLRGRNIDEVFITGLAGDICVYFTMKDALELGFKATLIKDCTFPIDARRFEETMLDLNKHGAKVVSSSELLE